MFTAIVYFGALKVYANRLISWLVAAVLVAGVPYGFSVLMIWINGVLRHAEGAFVQAVTRQGVVEPLAQLAVALVIFYLLEQNDSDREHSLTTWLFTGAIGLVLLALVVPYTLNRLL